MRAGGLAAVLLTAGASHLRADVLVPLDANWRWLKGYAEASTPDPTAWRELTFDDAAWALAPAPFWYGDAQSSPGTRITDMQNNYRCIFLRHTFVVPTPEDFGALTLEAACDDGFVAWINGEPVARYNVPDGELGIGALALTYAQEPVPYLGYPLSDPLRYLRAGTNVLAIQVFNSTLGSTDLVFNGTLTGTVDETAPAVLNVSPEALSVVRTLTAIEIQFTEGVGGVDAADLLINLEPATNAAAISPSQWLFSFPAPATGIVHVAWAPAHGIHDLSRRQNPFTGQSWTYTFNPNAPPEGVMISEFMADNDKTLRDEDGDKVDWIELHNPTASAVNLNGWRLTDNPDEPGGWRIPNVSLGAKAYLVIYASDKNRTNPAAPLHTDFKLDAGGGYLALVDPASTVVSAFGPGYPAQYEDVSYGRVSGAPEVAGYFTSPTPGAANATAGPGFAPAVEFSRRSGTYTAPFSLELSVPLPGASIWYAFGTNAVSPSSTLYTAPLAITNGVHVRARAFAPNLLPGPIRSETYLRLDPALRTRTSNLPMLILHNFGGGDPMSRADQFVTLQAYEPRYGTSSMTNAPDLAVHGVFHRRGSSTFGNSKGSYFVEVRDENGNDRNVSLVGLPEDSDWVLYAPNWFEPVLVHNPVALELSRQMGRYAPRTRLVEVYLKNDTATDPNRIGPVSAADYNGIYVVTEKIKIDRNRVAIDPLEPEHTTSPKVTGGYLLSIDRSAEGTSPFWAGGASMNYVDPDYFDMQLPQRQAQRNYIAGYFNAFYSALTGTRWTDPAVGYAAYIDVPSWIDHHLHGVVTLNVDALRLSGYFYKPREGKIEMGPVWDFDRTQGSRDGRDFNPRLWRSNYQPDAQNDNGTDMFNAHGIFQNPWYSRLFKDLDFWQLWIDRYTELRRSVLSNTNLAELIDRQTGVLRLAQPREAARWSESNPRSGTQSANGYSYSFPGTYQGEVDFMKSWYSNRLDFLDTNFVRPPAFNLPPGPVAPGALLTVAGDPLGQVYYTTDGSDPRLAGGAVSPRAQTYQAPVRLEANVRIVARCRDPQHANMTGAPGKPPLSSLWSGPLAATYYTAIPTLRVTEIAYRPAPPPPGDPYASEDYAFIELKNPGSVALDLAGAGFTNGIHYTFSSTSGVTRLEPGGYVLLVKNATAFRQRHPTATNVAGEYSGSLDNAGERLVLVGPLQEPIADFRYEPQWHPATDGIGFSLVARDETSVATNRTASADWRPSSLLGGSPGQPDPPPPAFPALVVNEVLTRTDPPATDAIELFNPTADDVDLGGWFLSDDFDEPRKFVFPAGTILRAGGHLWLDESAFHVAGDAGFSFSALGDEACLFSGDGQQPTGYVHGFAFGAAANGVSFGRYVTRLGAEHCVAQAALTLGGENAGPSVGPVVLTELHVEPPPVNGYNNVTDEFVELHNLGIEPVPLFDPEDQANRWRLRGGVDFDFPANTVLAPGGFLLVVSFDPNLEPWAADAFRARFNVDPAVPLLGPFEGRLENAGERIALERPDPPRAASPPGTGQVPYVLVESIRYASAAPWPTGAAATGHSLQRICPGTFGDDPLNWQAAAPTAGRTNAPGLADADGDGLPDHWELAQRLNPYLPGGENGPHGDPDGDSFDNMAEWTAGTDARDAGSLLEFTEATPVENGLQILFQAVAGKTYTVLYRDDLEPGSWTRLVDVPAQAASGPVTIIDSAHAPSRYYQLVTPRLQTNP